MAARSVYLHGTGDDDIHAGSKPEVRSAEREGLEDSSANAESTHPVKLKVLGLLDKINAKNLTSIVNTLCSVPVRSEKDLQVLAQTLVRKALTEVYRCEVYANLFLQLQERYPDLRTKALLKKECNFRPAFLETWRIELTDALTTLDIAAKGRGESYEVDLRKLKLSSLSNITCHMLLKKVTPCKVIGQVILDVMDHQKQGAPDSCLMLCICSLLRRIGSKLEDDIYCKILMPRIIERLIVLKNIKLADDTPAYSNELQVAMQRLMNLQRSNWGQADSSESDDIARAASAISSVLSPSTQQAKVQGTAMVKVQNIAPSAPASAISADEKKVKRKNEEKEKKKDNKSKHAKEKTSTPTKIALPALLPSQQSFIHGMPMLAPPSMPVLPFFGTAPMFPAFPPPPPPGAPPTGKSESSKKQKSKGDQHHAPHAGSSKRKRKRSQSRKKKHKVRKVSRRVRVHRTKIKKLRRRKRSLSSESSSQSSDSSSNSSCSSSSNSRSRTKERLDKTRGSKKISGASNASRKQSKMPVKNAALCVASEMEPVSTSASSSANVRVLSVTRSAEGEKTISTSSNVSDGGNLGAIGNGVDGDGKPASMTTSTDEGALQLEQWLHALDAGRGSMLEYLEALQREFGDLHQLSAAAVPKDSGGSMLEAVDTMLFEALGIKSLGHKLIFARGVSQLASGRGITS